LRALGGHFWTVAPYLRHRCAPVRAPVARPWSTTVPDPSHGPVRLSGWLAAPEDARALLVVVHGLGGSAESHYVLPAACAAAEAGLACLRLNLRGADGSGEDFYHAGLAEDLRAALADAALARFDAIAFLGFSEGGHVVLRYAAEGTDPRVRAVAAICPPLDLDRAAAAIDRPERALYRRHVLGGLARAYAPVAARRPVPCEPAAARRIRTIREWDRRIVAPRHGFASAEDYYARASVAPLLGRIAAPALLIAAEHDPMVPAGTLRPALAGAGANLEVRWLARGGHVGFPAALALERELVAWLKSRVSAPPG
jgi:predicted alpha/beta-fold hydrolase